MVKKRIFLMYIQMNLVFVDCDTVLLEFSNFSNETYSYYNSLGSHRDKGLGVFGGEVVPVYTNVNNGLGALISVNSQSKF